MFADTLSSYSDNVAVILADGQALNYRELQQNVDQFVTELGSPPNKKLIFLPADNSLASLIAYLACLRQRFPMLLLNPEINNKWLNQLVNKYRPNGVINTEHNFPKFVELSNERLELHPDLALLLSTSGSTGTPKQVKLSYQNLEANADSIIRYLELTSRERAITSLPMHYSYGLSVINSYLMVGASIVLSQASIVSREFWNLFKQHNVTSLSGVPYTYETLHRLRFHRMDLPSLNYMTQAGGRLKGELILYFAEHMKKQGKRLFVMYGQTEATARIAYVPSAMVDTHPTSIGIAIPGGKLLLEDNTGREIEQSGQVGELVYYGSNIMMGYALSLDDLSRGHELQKLKTGDLARKDESGFFYITGRKTRTLKLFGVRVDLDEVEKRLMEEGWEAFCIGNDKVMGVAIQSAEFKQPVEQYITEVLQLHHSVISVQVISEIPRTSNGKVNYCSLMELLGCS